MPKRTNILRRNFLGDLCFAGTAAAGATLIHPMQAAAQAVGVKPGDLPDLTIKEAKVYVANINGVRKLNSSENGWIFSLVTNSGIEGNYTDGNRGLTPNWLEYAKATCVGKNLFDLLPLIPSSASYSGARAGGGATDGGVRGAAAAGPAGAAAPGGARAGADAAGRSRAGLDSGRSSPAGDRAASIWRRPMSM